MTERLEMSPEKMIEILKMEVMLRDHEIQRLNQEIEKLKVELSKK